MTKKDLRKLRELFVQLIKTPGFETMSMSQFCAFLVAADSYGTATVSSVAAEMDKPIASTVRALDLFTGDGRGDARPGKQMLERISDPDDRRSHTLSLTSKGEAFLFEELRL